MGQAEDVSRAGAVAPGRALRHFGRFQLLRLLGKSARSMLWRVAEERGAKDLLLLLPRQPCASAAAALAAAEALRAAHRTAAHPKLAPPREVGHQGVWPFVVYDPAGAPVLSERMPAAGFAASEGVQWLQQVLQALGALHEAGLGHGDLQPFMVLAGPQRDGRLLGAGLAEACAGQADPLRTQRDLLGCGLLMPGLLAGRWAFDEIDLGQAAERVAPWGEQVCAMPWPPDSPVPPTLQAVAQRATHAQPALRYRNAREIGTALKAWQQACAGELGGPAALLVERTRRSGLLPAAPDTAERSESLLAMENQRTHELALVLLQDLGLSFELLRAANRAQRQSRGGEGSVSVLTLRRALAMLGTNGVRSRAAALQPWPGGLQPAQATALQSMMSATLQAARTAVALREPGFDVEVVCAATMLQSLGRLLIGCHLPLEAAQIRALSAADAGGGQPMDEDGATSSVLGMDAAAIGIHVARPWGVDEATLALMQALPLGRAPAHPQDDDARLRALASCAHEAVQAAAQGPGDDAPGLLRVLQRYGGMLGFDLGQLRAALALRSLDEAVAGSAEEPPPPPLELANATDDSQSVVLPAGASALRRRAVAAARRETAG